MRRLEITDADLMRITIQNEIQRSQESRYDHRLQGSGLLGYSQTLWDGKLLSHHLKTRF